LKNWWAVRQHASANGRAIQDRWPGLDPTGRKSFRISLLKRQKAFLREGSDAEPAQMAVPPELMKAVECARGDRQVGAGG